MVETNCLKSSSGRTRKALDRTYGSRYLQINGGLNILHTLYMAQLWRKDELHSYRDMKTGEIFKGCIRDVTDKGFLIVENEEGELQEFAFKEIAYMI